MSPGSNTVSYPAFAHIGLRESPGKNLNQDMYYYRQLTVSVFSVQSMKTSEMSFCVYHDGQAKKRLNEGDDSRAHKLYREPPAEAMEDVTGDLCLTVK
ncbi:hypothetical protein ANN_23843 [Periplaneta americana]|uniref:Uncharacterized protein n=1 Tax=Periplaneta americana TaxID=6978 RepID=A0ABQ8SM85_PERAM|nr:hypothetical protein ANN_23843 [Periplaneta americana]